MLDLDPVRGQRVDQRLSPDVVGYALDLKVERGRDKYRPDFGAGVAGVKNFHFHFLLILFY